MLPKRWIGILVYLVGDFIAAMVAWTLFFLARKIYMENNPFSWKLLDDSNFYYAIVIIPIAWVLLYTIFDSYKDIYRISRMSTIFKTLFLSLVGVLVIFFAILLNDWIWAYEAYYWLAMVLFLLHFFTTLIFRMTILTVAANQLKAGKVGYNTLIIGGNKTAVDLYQEIASLKDRIGYKFKGFVDSNGSSTNELLDHLDLLGKIEDIPKIIKEQEIEEVIIAIETSDHKKLKGILSTLYDYNVVIKIIPDMYDILLGSVKMNHVYGAVLIEIYPEIMPLWQRLVKRIMDIVASVLGLLLLSPLLLYIIIRVRLSSNGPIFYWQERIGLHGTPFYIVKFRSMYTDAENAGPQLSQDNDARCTPWGAVMRKWRLDELPQFWNVIKGEMSLVGPRPERRFFIDQIVEQAPHYKQLLKVRPGITSWGQVKYGYASNVEEMLQRLRYDILYIENMSLILDIKILMYTVLTIVQGRGK